MAQASTLEYQMCSWASNICWLLLMFISYTL